MKVYCVSMVGDFTCLLLNCSQQPSVKLHCDNFTDERPSDEKSLTLVHTAEGLQPPPLPHSVTSKHNVKFCLAYNIMQ